MGVSVLLRVEILTVLLTEIFKFFPIPSEKRQGRIVSSSLIRSLLMKGAIEEANGLLGHPFVIEGPVIKGHARGKSLGFPTANISTDNEIVPHGIYFSYVFSELALEDET